MKNIKSLGIVLPALNEQSSLEQVVMEILELQKDSEWSFEIIIINDGSTDNTGKIADELAKHKMIKVIHNNSPMNIGHCYKVASNLVNTQFITWLPTDGEINPDVIKEMLALADENKIIIPFPIEGKENRSILRRALSSTYQEVLNKIFGLKIRYYNGNSILPTSIFTSNNFYSKGFTINAEIILFSVLIKKLNYVEVPFSLRKRVGDKEKALALKNIYNVLKSVLVLYKRYRA